MALSYEDPKFLQALGRVAINFTALDIAVDVAIYALVEPATVVIFLSVMTFRQKVDVLAGFLADIHPDLLGKDSIITKISQCEDKRNQMLHSWWPEEDGVLYRASEKIRRKSGFIGTWEATSANDLNDTANMIRDTVLKLGEITDALEDGVDDAEPPTASPS